VLYRSLMRDPSLITLVASLCSGLRSGVSHEREFPENFSLRF
jgi:hypothetical protein